MPRHTKSGLVLVNNFAIRLNDEVERAKIALSSTLFGVIQLTGDDADDIDLWQPIARAQFESLIAVETRRIQDCLLDTLKRSGLSPDEIDAVVRTGSSAQIPRFVEMLGRIFGPEKVMLSDVFGGVVAGLAMRAGNARYISPSGKTDRFELLLLCRHAQTDVGTRFRVRCRSRGTRTDTKSDTITITGSGHAFDKW